MAEIVVDRAIIFVLMKNQTPYRAYQKSYRERAAQDFELVQASTSEDTSWELVEVPVYP